MYKQKTWENPRKTNDFLKSLTRESEKVKKKTVFPEVPTAQKCCKKQYEIKIFVVREQEMDCAVMKMKITYGQKT